MGFSLCFNHKFHIFLAITWLCLAIFMLFGIPSGTLLSAREWSLRIRDHKGWFKYWRRSVKPGVLSVYFFNITNPEEVINGYRANISEVGPFEYEVLHEKVNIDFEGDERVSYQNKYKYHFIHPELHKSKHEKHDHDHDYPNMLIDSEAMIYTFNYPVLIALSEISKIKMRPIKQAYMAELTGHFDIIKSISVKNILNIGFADDFKHISDVIASIYSNDVTKERCSGLFSWIFSKNDSVADDTFVIDTGDDDFDYVNTLISVNDKKQLPFWNSMQCNNLRDVTVDKMFGPNIDDDDIDWLKIYEPSACRVMKWKVIDDDAEAYAGEWKIDTKRLKLHEKNFHNSDVEKDNFCYETNAPSPSGYSQKYRELEHSIAEDKKKEKKKKKKGQEDVKRSASKLPSGVMDVSICNGDAPIFISQPYFISGNKDYFKDTINFMNGPLSDANQHVDPFDGKNLLKDPKHEEDKDIRNSKYQSFMDIEPYTGAVVKYKLRYQLNLALSSIPSDDLKVITGMPKELHRLIYPIFWYEYDWSVSKKEGKKLWLILELSWILGFTFMGILIACAAISASFAYYFYVNGPSTSSSSFSAPRLSNPFRRPSAASPPVRTQTFATYQSNSGAVNYGNEVAGSEPVARLRYN